ncbi:hypothetical protein [Desulforamulus aquiferis]|uniref:PrsW family intramembrane metalloprotease n=1 Tax=Desulforamulus aquiferis TaxID=1397668 RepID=A0AAW7ZFE9_9FIRM|nr:hypothetical protein [Desulforamulus aquiferis]MDO7788049.1 hypothetical protein [Desulforamulus aquiferis]
MPNIIPLPHIFLILTAAFLAAGITWFFNSLVINKLGDRGISFVTPAIEEIAKTGVAIGLGAAIVWTHLAFGLVEAVVEIRRRGIRGLSAGWAALAGHSLFGLIASWVYMRRGFLWAVLITYLIHAAWNWGIIYYSNRNRSRLD